MPRSFLNPCRWMGAALLLAWGVLTSLRASETQQYRGFTIDDAPVGAQANREPVRAAVREQIDMVWAVGLPPEVLAFFQRTPFEIVPPATMPSGTPGRYVKGKQVVQVSSGIVNIGHKPVLLHELLHAWHDVRMPGSNQNADILRLYGLAKGIPAFAATAHMMANPMEYFACSATTYLFGVTAQEPFTRAKLRENQPEAYAYLQKLFGAGAGNYAGSLTQAPAGEKSPAGVAPQAASGAK